MKLPTKTMTSKHLPDAVFTIELTHVPDAPHGAIVFEAIVSDGIVSSKPDRRDLASDAVTRDFVARMGLDTFPPRALSTNGLATDPAANLQQMVDAFRQAAVDSFAWKQAAKLIAPQIDLTPKSMASNHLPGTTFAVDAKQIETEDGTLVFEITVSSDLSSYREVQRHGIGGYGGAGMILTVDGVQQMVDSFRQWTVDAIASKLATHQAFSQLE